MNSKAWFKSLVACMLGVAVCIALFNYITDPFNAFGDRFMKWYSYDFTMNPRVAKLNYIDEHHDEYDSYIIGCSSTSSFSVDGFNELYDASFYNMINYGADMLDCEKISEYLIENYEVKNLVLNVYILNGHNYEKDTHSITAGLTHRADPEISAAEYYYRYFFASPSYGIKKLQSRAADEYLPEKYDVFNVVSGVYDKRERDVERIGTMDDYLLSYPVFANYPNGGAPLDKTKECMESVARIRDICEENGVEFICIAGPVYAERYFQFDGQEVRDFYTSLADVTPYYDFSINSTCFEPRYFYDETHFRNNVGDMLVRYMSGSEGYLPEDFGYYVTTENVEEHLNTIRTAQRAEDISVRLPVLMFHDFTQDEAKDYTITAEVFEEQIKAITEAGYTAISIDELQEYVGFGAELPEKPMLITIDDGYMSNYEIAFPILQKYNQKATIFAIGYSFGTDEYKDTGIEINPHFGAEEAVEMVNSGLISIQSHTYNMHEWGPYETDEVRSNVLPLDGEDEEEYVSVLTEDFAKSRELLSGVTGEEIDALAYPCGQYTDLSQHVLKEMGVKVTFSTEVGVNEVIKGLPQSMLCLKRIEPSNGTTAEQLLEMIK